MTHHTITAEDLDQYLQEFDESAEVVPAYAYSELVKDYFHKPQNSRGVGILPWSKAHGKFNVRPGEVTIWAGYNGSGKSLLVGQILLSLMGQGHRACIASMEMLPEVTLARMARQAAGWNLPSEEFIQHFHSWLDGKLWMYKQQNTVRHQRMVALARYCGKGVLQAGKKLPIQHLVIDSLMKCGIRVDDYNTQKDYIDQLCSVAKDTGMHIHLVAHMRKGDSEFSPGDKMDIKGASEITDQVDNVFVLWRNKSKEAEQKKSSPNQEKLSAADAILTCSKQRHGEDEPAFGLYFHKASMQYVGFDKARPIEFLKTHTEAA